MDKTIKIDDQVFKALDLKIIRRLICNTDKGLLELVIRKGESKYFLTLDAVPLPKVLNEELMGILFPKPIIPQVNKDVVVNHPPGIGATPVLVKKLGRPAGSKSGKGKME